MTEDLFYRAAFSELSPAVVDSFVNFHRKNPRVYALLEKAAFEVWDAGFRHFGIACLWENVRWKVAMETKGDDFKLNNSFRSAYARLLILEHPQFQNFFQTRKSKAAA